MINPKNFKFIISIFAFALLACEKEERCGIIIDKVVVEDRYYFIFDSDDLNQFGGTEINQTMYYVPDNRSSGEVSEGIFNEFKIGEEYCQS